MTAPETIAELIASRAASHPHDVAIRAPDRAPLTYGDLHAAVARITRTLHAMGLARSDRVALVLPNHAETAVAFLAVASAMGCAPLNPMYREDDFAFAFADLGVAAVIVEAGGGAPAIAAARRRALPVIALAPIRDAPAGIFTLHEQHLGAPPRVSGVSARHVALVLHTSGTTARPKTVPLTQRNLCAAAYHIGRTLELDRADICLNAMPLFHVHGLVGALLSSISAGASIECGGDFRAAEFAARLPESGATWYSAVPTIHQAILAAVTGDRGTNGCPLRFIRSASAALAPQVMADLADHFQVPVIEAYGMTEAAHQMASNPLRAGAQKPGSVGLPAGPELALLDDTGRIVSSGVGEVVVRGETVMAGYEGNPDANAAAFVEGWLRTGDQGRIDDDGYLFLIGRLKELINRGGEKIAPREIEEALLRHAAVAQAVAFGVPHPRLGEAVGAAVVLKPSAAATPAELRQRAFDSLAYFKVPRIIHVVERIPTGPTGKPQRVGLAHTLGLVADRADSRAPRTQMERTLAAEYARLLNVDAVGVDDDFFELGGDSLGATELLVLASELLDTEIPIVDFVERPTISALIESARRAAARDAATADDVVALQAEGHGPPIFCAAPHDNSLWRVSRLLRYVGRDRPTYGLRVAHIGARGPVLTLAELAKRNIATMLRMNPRGPHYLVGPCFGGVVAFEMARQLEQLGRPVALLVMIDSFNRAWRQTYREESQTAVRTRHLRDRVRFHWRKIRHLGKPARAAYARQRLALLVESVATETAHCLFAALTAAGLPRPARLQTCTYSNEWAERRYRPQPYAGPVLMARATAPVAGVYPLPELGWSGLVGETTMIQWPIEQRELWWNDAALQHIAAEIRQRIAAHERAERREELGC